MTYTQYRDHRVAPNVRDGLYLVEQAEVSALFSDHVRNPGGPGRPRTNDRLSLKTFLVLVYVLFTLERDISWAEMARLIFTGLDDELRAELGLTDPYWTDPAHVRAFAGNENNGNNGTGPTLRPNGQQMLEDLQVQERVTAAMRKGVIEFLAPMDTTVLAANKKHPVRALREARKAAADLKSRAALRDEVCHRLLLASLTLGNVRNGFGTDLSQGIFAKFEGHFGVDETRAVVAYGQHAGDVNTALQMSAQSAYNRHLKYSDQVGLNAIITSSGSKTRTVPEVMVALSFGLPGEAAGQHVLNSLDLIEELAPDMAPLPRKKGRKAKADTSGRRTTNARFRYIVGDKAYPVATGLLAGLLKRNYVLVGEPGQQQRAFVRLKESGSTATEGPMLTKHGAIVCPGTNREYLEKIRTLYHPNNPTPGEQAELDKFDRMMRAFKMGSKDATPQLQNVSRGRPSATQPPRREWKMQVSCPAREGRVLCPLLLLPAEEEKKLIEQGTPRVQEDDLPRGEVPKCCRADLKGTSVVVFSDTSDEDEIGVKTWQPLVAATPAHRTVYSPTRSHTEAYFSVLKKAVGWDRGRTEWKTDSVWSIAATMAGVRANILIMDAFARGQHVDSVYRRQTTKTIARISETGDARAA